MDELIYLVYLAIGGIILFFIIAGAVKIAVRQALYEFKEEIVKEINKKSSEEKGNNR